MHPTQPTIPDGMLRSTIDEADPAHRVSSLSAQGCFLGDELRRLQEVATQVNELTTNLAQLAVRLTVTTQDRGPVLPTIAPPKKYSARCRGFLLQSPLYFTAHEPAKINIFMGFLKEDALRWAMAIWENSNESFSPYEQFVSMFRRFFDHAPRRRRSASKFYPSDKVTAEQPLMLLSSVPWPQRAAGMSPP